MRTKGKWEGGEEVKVSLFQQLLCYLFGHKFYNLFYHDNGHSYIGTVKCQRCGYQEDFQYDHTL